MCLSTQGYQACHSDLLFSVSFTVTRGEVTVGLVMVHKSAPGCRLWSVAGDVLFDQLSREFRKDEVNVRWLSGCTPLGEPIAACLPVYFTGSSNRPLVFSVRLRGTQAIPAQ